MASQEGMSLRMGWRVSGHVRMACQESCQESSQGACHMSSWHREICQEGADNVIEQRRYANK